MRDTQEGERSRRDSCPSSRLSLKGSGGLLAVADGGWVVRSAPAVGGGVSARGPLLGPDGGEAVAVELGEVVGRHQ
jgi:hypothetical protein